MGNFEKDLGINAAMLSTAAFYRYKCEKCGHDTQWKKLNLPILYLETKDGVNKALRGARFSSASEEIPASKEAAVASIKMCYDKLKERISSGDYSMIMDTKCPSCGQKQEWTKNPVKRSPGCTVPEFLFCPQRDGELLLGDFIADENREALSSPCGVNITGQTVAFAVTGVMLYLNGLAIGEYKNGVALRVQTNDRFNRISVCHSTSGAPLLSYSFEAQSGGNKDICFLGNRFSE